MMPRAKALIYPLRCAALLGSSRAAAGQKNGPIPRSIQPRMFSSGSLARAVPVLETDACRSPGWREFREKLAACSGGSIDLNKCYETGIATVTINNPKIRNAFSGSMILELADAVAELETWREGKGLLVHGAGEFFTSGADLNTVMKLMDPVSGGMFSSFMQDTLQRLRRLPMISVSVTQGGALGGGAETALATDFRIMTTSSYLAFVQSKYNISTVFGGGTMLTKLVGRSVALDLLASGRHVGSEEALRVGLADKVVPDGENAVDLGKTWLSELTRGTVEVVQGIKSVVMAASELSEEESLHNERRVLESLWGFEEHKCKVESVLQKCCQS